MRYQSPGLFRSTSDAAPSTTLQVRALLFYEGAHTDSIGKRQTYSAEKIEAIALATNDYLASGRRAKFFEDHEYTQRGTLGAIAAPVECREIDTVPHEGMRDLIGKKGIYGVIEIAGEDNVTAYLDGRIKEISVGIDLDGKSFGFAGAIYELSAVGIPALAGAALFALTIAQAVQEEESKREVWRDWDVFTEVMMSIDRATDEEIAAANSTRPALKAKAVEDLADRLRSRFPPVAQAPPTAPPTVPLFEQAMSDYTPEQIKELEDRASKFEAMERQLATLQRSQAVTAKFSTLKDKAIQLKADGKLTPAHFKELGFDEAETSIAKFSAGDDSELTRLEIELGAIEKYATPVKLGSYLGNEPIDDVTTLQKEADAKVAAYKAAHSPKPSYHR